MNKIECNGFKRINKIQARKRYESGKSVFLLPCNVAPNSIWIKPIRIKDTSNEFDFMPEWDLFDSKVNAFEYYNCNSELGKYASYYIKEDN